MNALVRRRTPADTVKESRLYNRLPVLRAERGLSRQDLADALGINYQTVGYIERGDFNPGLELTFRISEVLPPAHRGDLFAPAVPASQRGGVSAFSRGIDECIVLQPRPHALM